MVIKDVQDLLVYRKALEAALAVSAILRRSALCDDFELGKQLGTSSARVPVNIAEGFGQKTDRHFAQYLYIARGSANEVCAHLAIAQGRGDVSAEESSQLSARYVEIARMLTGLIKHLRKEDRKQRG